MFFTTKTATKSPKSTTMSRAFAYSCKQLFLLNFRLFKHLKKAKISNTSAYTKQRLRCAFPENFGGSHAS